MCRFLLQANLKLENIKTAMPPLMYCTLLSANRNLFGWFRKRIKAKIHDRNDFSCLPFRVKSK